MEGPPVAEGRQVAAAASRTSDWNVDRRRIAMRILALSSLVTAAALLHAAPASAREPAWCAAYRNGSNNCGFYTY